MATAKSIKGSSRLSIGQTAQQQPAQLTGSSAATSNLRAMALDIISEALMRLAIVRDLLDRVARNKAPDDPLFCAMYAHAVLDAEGRKMETALIDLGNLAKDCRYFDAE